MKPGILIYMFIVAALLFTFLLVSCNEVEGESASTGWGINVSPRESAGNAYGYISRQNAGANGTYLIDSAYVRSISHGQYHFIYKFTSFDSMKLIIAKRTHNFNFHYPQADTVNQLLYALFNADTLQLNESSVSIQPVFENHTFHTVTNLHSVNKGSINGTIDGVPLID